MPKTAFGCYIKEYYYWLQMQLRSAGIRRTTIISSGLALFLIGIALARLRLSAGMILVFCTVLTVVVFVAIKNKSRFIIALLLPIVMIVGLWRGTVMLARLDVITRLYGHEVVLEVTAKEDAIYSDRKQLIFASDDILLKQPRGQRLIGSISVEGFGESMVYRGDRVLVSGKLYPKRGDNVAGVAFAQMDVIERSASKVDNVRRYFAAGLQNVLPEPLASFALGLLIGQRNTLPDDVKDELVAAGLIHIVAVSGYNLTILINFSRHMLERRSRYQALLGSVLLIGLFLLLTWSSPSIVRAAIVSIIGLVMWFFGRNIKPVLLILLAAAITAGINPLYIWSSIGWYLSFAAFFGVLVLAPLLRRRFLNKKHQDKSAPQLLSETLAAQICTLPILLFVFGRMSGISLIANIIVVPFVPFAMLASLVAGLYGMLGITMFGFLIVMPAKVLLTYILMVGEKLSAVPYATFSLGITAFQMVIIYMCIAGSAIVLWKKMAKSARITDKK